MSADGTRPRIERRVAPPDRRSPETGPEAALTGIRRDPLRAVTAAKWRPSPTAPRIVHVTRLECRTRLDETRKSVLPEVEFSLEARMPRVRSVEEGSSQPRRSFAALQARDSSRHACEDEIGAVLVNTRAKASSSSMLSACEGAVQTPSQRL